MHPSVGIVAAIYFDPLSQRIEIDPAVLVGEIILLRFFGIQAYFAPEILEASIKRLL